MYSQGVNPRGYYPTFNENRPPSMPHQRPVGSHSYSQSQFQPANLNKSYNKISSQGMGYPLHRNNLSRSKVSLASSQASHLSNLVN